MTVRFSKTRPRNYVAKRTVEPALRISRAAGVMTAFAAALLFLVTCTFRPDRTPPKKTVPPPVSMVSLRDFLASPWTWLAVGAMVVTIAAATIRAVLKNVGAKPGYPEMMAPSVSRSKRTRRKRSMHRLPLLLCISFAILGVALIVYGAINEGVQPGCSLLNTVGKASLQKSESLYDCWEAPVVSVAVVIVLVSSVLLAILVRKCCFNTNTRDRKKRFINT